jgi:endonuclease/exonuclease/phosphatase family metal-dependent hydrolase
MPIPHARPKVTYRYDLARELDALDHHFARREVPRSTRDTLMVATWNIACLGCQPRSDDDLALIAFILRRFDLVAIQEVATHAGHLHRLVELLGPAFDCVMTDPSGNAERLAYIYRRRKVRRGRLAGELALDPNHYPTRTITIRYERRGKKFEVKHDKVVYRPFSRTPFLHAFESEGRTITFANAHLYRGNYSSPISPAAQLAYCRRALEAYALARWARTTTRRNDREGGPVVVLGDLNIPRMDGSDEAHRALRRFGLKMPEHPTQTGATNIKDDATYDQIVLTPPLLEDPHPRRGVFDFDKALFAKLWTRLLAEHGKRRALTRFNPHMQFHVSDHRPVWTELRLR